MVSRGANEPCPAWDAHKAKWPKNKPIKIVHDTAGSPPRCIHCGLECVR